MRQSFVIGGSEAPCELQKRAGKVRDIERFDKPPGRADLAGGSRSEESMQLLMCRRFPVLRHGLETPERIQLALFRDDALYRGDAERANQFVLEVGDAREEARFFD